MNHVLENPDLSVSIWFEAEKYERATFVLVLKGIPHQDVQDGEVGIILENDYAEKYDARVLLPPTYGPQIRESDSWLESLMLSGERIFYFYGDQLEYLRGPGFGDFGPGRTPHRRTPEEIAEDEWLAAAIDHDARRGL